MTGRQRVLAVAGVIPLSALRRYWWVIPVALVAREVVGAILMTTVIPWLWSIVAALEAAG